MSLDKEKAARKNSWWGIIARDDKYIQKKTTMFWGSSMPNNNDLGKQVTLTCHFA